jgi:SpoVK/Ycf46/Vps4 family AAA+-type ATPase
MDRIVSQLLTEMDNLYRPDDEDTPAENSNAKEEDSRLNGLHTPRPNPNHNHNHNDSPFEGSSPLGQGGGGGDADFSFLGNNVSVASGNSSNEGNNVSSIGNDTENVSKEILFDEIYADRVDLSVAIYLDSAVLPNKDVQYVPPEALQDVTTISTDPRWAEGTHHNGTERVTKSKRNLVFVIAATNRPDLLEPGQT